MVPLKVGLTAMVSVKEQDLAPMASSQQRPWPCKAQPKTTPAAPAPLINQTGDKTEDNDAFAAVIAEAWQDASRIKAAAELSPEEQVKPLAYDLADAEKTAEGLQTISNQLPAGMCKKLASTIHAGGAADFAQVESAEVISISPVWEALFIPLRTTSVPSFGADQGDVAPGNVWCYTWAHGTTTEAAVLILREQMIRPTVGGDSMANTRVTGSMDKGPSVT